MNTTLRRFILQKTYLNKKLRIGQLPIQDVDAVLTRIDAELERQSLITSIAVARDLQRTYNTKRRNKKASSPNKWLPKQIDRWKKELANFEKDPVFDEPVATATPSSNLRDKLTNFTSRLFGGYEA